MYNNTYIPTTIVDGFFDNPDAVREFALKQDYSVDLEGRWPGVRTTCISKISPIIFEAFCVKTLSLFFPRNQWYYYEAHAFFQIVDSNFESGWIHKDPDIITAIAYLNPGLTSGTSLYFKKNIDYNCDNILIQKKIDAYKCGKDDSNSRKLHNDQFEETISVKGLYNRLMVFDSNIYHSAHDFFGKEKENSRLTLICFFRTLRSNLDTPLYRCKTNYNVTSL